MKITKSQLKQIIKEELLKEYAGARNFGGVAGALGDSRGRDEEPSRNTRRHRALRDGRARERPGRRFRGARRCVRGVLVVARARSSLRDVASCDRPARRFARRECMLRLLFCRVRCICPEQA